MSGKRYLTLNEYDGALTGLLPNPAGPNDVPSPGGLSSIDHHWTHGLFGAPERVTDVYAGTGERYIYGPYGNLYTPNAHGNTYDDYRGPHSDRTEYETLHGDPYFWQLPIANSDSRIRESGAISHIALNNGRELVHHRNAGTKIMSGSNMNVSNGRPVTPRENVGFVPSNIENYKAVDTETMIEFIEEPQAHPPKNGPQKSSGGSSLSKSQKPPASTCNKPATQSIPDSQKTTDVFANIPNQKQKNRTMVIVLLISILVCIDLWGEFTHIFIIQYLNKGKDATWVRYAIYAVAATIAVIVAVQYSGVKVPVCA